MSWLAHIAYENPDGTFDVYKSHNGAEEFYLTPYLREVIEGEADRTLSTVDARKPWDSMGSSPPGDKVDSLDDAVSNQLVARGVPEAELPGVIDFIHSEGLYVVRDEVEIYLPVWTYPRVLDALSEFFELEVYDLDDTYLERAREGGGLLNEDVEPISTLSGTDFYPRALDDPVVRKYIERNHLSLFQTGTDPLDSGGRKPSGGGVMFDNMTIMNEKETDFILPSGKGRGVLVQLNWNDDFGRPIDLRYVRDYAELSRIDVSCRIIESRQDGEEINENREELKYVGQLVQRLSNRVSDLALSPFDGYIEIFADRFGARAKSDGELYRVVGADQDAGEYTFRPKEEPITPKKDVWTQSTDIDTLSVTPPSEGTPTRAQFDHLRQGDIMNAELKKSDTGDYVATSVELQRRTEVAFVESDFVPSFVEEKYHSDLEPELGEQETDSGALIIGSALRSYSDELDGSRKFVGEFLIAAGAQADSVWERVENGQLAEPMYGGFRNQGAEAPSESLFVNPPDSPFWYGLVFEAPRTGLSREMHNELGLTFPD